ncbi:hypothetical protein F5Y04DRAFT_195997 [Hypomontagnella monticulosa]|nr:hypothetical protein F5Y04DRAFT_195997 [Hypomontagnella monticulosa]
MPSSEQSELLATPCVTCREHHLKCDRMVPKCSRCVRAQRECKLGFKFKPSKDKFPGDQRWPEPPRQLTYVDETRGLIGGGPLETTSFYELHIGVPHARDPESTSSSITPPAIPSSREHMRPVNQPAEVTQARNPSRSERMSSSSESTPTAEFHRRGSLSDSKSTARYGMHSLSNGNNAHTHVPYPRDDLAPNTNFRTESGLPLKTREEAELFQRYIQKLAICLDLCDPQRHFELIVPERAARCHTLKNAVFAIAARHRSHTTADIDPYASNMYSDECLKELIPLLNDTSKVYDENLFAAAVILRMLEEMDVPTTGKDDRNHIPGIQAFAKVEYHYMKPGTLHTAAFWVGLRQEIYIAIILQQPVDLSLDHAVVDRTLEPADDFTWSNRAVVLLADVLNFCFRGNGRHLDRWEALDGACQGWSVTRPQSFNPFYFGERTAHKPFPEIFHTSSCHIIGIQHHILAQLLLIQFDPSIPLGPTRPEVIQRMTHRIENLVRELCGIGVTNQWTPPSMFTACMGIAMFGDRFTARSDQEALVDILVKTEADHSRPTAVIKQQLTKAWGWAQGEEQMK